MMAVNAWTERPSKRNDAMLVDVITWGMDVEAFRSVVRDLAPKRVGTFERLVSLARAKTLEASEQLTCIPSASRAARL